ncbi:MAG: hypothetical protein JO336_00885 [Acidobacteriia bacterium]|nr:hypothetical protein [Terriglobia bacterium]MBV8907081.1 hypothetical protein [Terriglobia bacterium]
MVLAPRSLAYAHLALQSLFANSEEALELSLITDSAQDKDVLGAEMSLHPMRGKHTWSIYSASDLEEREEAIFGRFDQLRAFRRGHPCWRKLTDPVLLSAEDQEMILLDPDLYFPNRFQFEATPAAGILLMWQKPSCLFPPEVVETALAAGIPLAHHVDIGVAHWRCPVDLEWMNWLLNRLGSPALPRSMHVEAIVWAALAMRFGGGHLDPRHWRCWHRSQYKRVLRKLGASGARILRSENLRHVKCFHAGGEAKWWLMEAQCQGILDRHQTVTTSGATVPFIELTPPLYRKQQRLKEWLRRSGYYTIFQQDYGTYSNRN